MKAPKLSISSFLLLPRFCHLWFLPENFTACSFGVFRSESLNCKLSPSQQSYPCLQFHLLCLVQLEFTCFLHSFFSHRSSFLRGSSQGHTDAQHGNSAWDQRWLNPLRKLKAGVQTKPPHIFIRMAFYIV